MQSRTLEAVVVRDDRTDAALAWSAWRVGFFPTFALLGVALPIYFLTWIERYLYYLRPLELVPTYGTAWLLLGALAMPFSLLCGFALQTLNLLPWLRSARSGLVIFLVGVTAVATVATLAYAVVVWVRTFGLLVDVPVHKELTAFSLGAVALIAIARGSHKALSGLYSITKYGALLGALSLASLPFSGWGNDARPSPPVPPPRAASLRSNPHILLVTIDTLSAQHMSLYGAARPTTPSLEAFARAATTFDRAYANANFTTTGISSILTATLPWTHRALQLPSWPTADARRNSLPALLSRAGYRTSYVATSTLAGPAKNGMGSYFDAGSRDRIPLFGLCSERLSVFLPYTCPAAGLPLLTLAESFWNRARRSVVDQSSNWDFDPRVASRSALEWLATADKRTPIFLWVHFLPPHSPYAAPKPWLGQFDSSETARDAAHSESEVAYLFANVAEERARVLEARYDESVKYTDYYVGEFLTQALRLLGDNTVVIVTADHGESFEHGYGMHTGPGLFESIIHIPLLVKFPGQTNRLRTSLVAEQIDIGPTLAELAGFTPPSSWEGRSLLGVWRSTQGAPPMTENPAFAMNFEENPNRGRLTTGSVAVIDGRWKLVRYTGVLRYPQMPQLHDELYDLATDPSELKNRISDQPDEAEHLRKLIAAELALHGGAVP